MGHKIGSARAAPTLREWFGGLEVAEYALMAWALGAGESAGGRGRPPGGDLWYQITACGGADWYNAVGVKVTAPLAVRGWGLMAPSGP